MVVEILYPEQEWPISLPREDGLCDRFLEARGSDGQVQARWRYSGNNWDGWICIVGRPSRPGVSVLGFSDRFNEIVAKCMTNGWTLLSLPPTGSRHEH